MYDLSGIVKDSTVDIFSDPITQKEFEGKAKILEVCALDQENKLAYCRVVFTFDNFKCTRKVYYGGNT